MGFGTDNTREFKGKVANIYASCWRDPEFKRQPGDRLS